MDNFRLYVVTNIINGKQYVGQTCRSMQERWNGHCKLSSTTSLLRQAIAKYGKDAFDVQVIIESLSIDQANDLEKLFIQLNSTLAPGGYNLQHGGMNGLHSEQTKQKISQSHRGRVFTEEHRKNLSGPRGPMSLESLEKRNTPEYSKLLSESQRGNKNHNFGKRTPDITRQKIGKALSGEKNHAYLHDIDRDEICERYLAKESARQIAISLGIGSSTVYRILQSASILRSRSEAQKGKKASAKTRKKQSKAHVGENNHFYGKTHSASAREKISRARRAKQESSNQLTLFQ